MPDPEEGSYAVRGTSCQLGLLAFQGDWLLGSVEYLLA